MNSDELADRYCIADIDVKEAWTGEARLSLIPHVNAPLADFPMVSGVGTGYHFYVDMVLPAGEVLHDCIKINDRLRYDYDMI